MAILCDEALILRIYFNCFIKMQFDFFTLLVEASNSLYQKNVF